MTRMWTLLVCVGVLVTGFGLVAVGLWRAGSVVMGCAMLVGAIERAILPDDAAGLLKVRRKSFDVVVMALAGVSVVVFALAVPQWS